MRATLTFEVTGDSLDAINEAIVAEIENRALHRI